VYDRRGHGRSDVPGAGYDLDTLADDLSRVVEHLDLTDMVLVGHSMGASEVVRYLSRKGSRRVAGLVLSAPTLPALRRTEANPNGIDMAVFEEAWRTMRQDIGLWLAQTSDQDYFGVGASVSADLGAWTRRQIVETPIPVLLACQRSFVETDFRSELRQLDVPTLVIQGNMDTSAPLELTGRPTAATIEGGRLAVIDGAGHGLYASAASRYNQELVEFIASCPHKSGPGIDEELSTDVVAH
jgi:pimeloyl-ACP methyl ester carboxylesterase